MKRYEINEVFEILGKEYLDVKTVRHGQRESIDVDGFRVKRSSLRYSLFYQKGTKCVCCGKEGTHFRLDAGEGQDPDASNRRHFNLYAEDGTMITKDHIVPKSFGGEDNVDNLQVMCKTCNELKRNTPEEDITLTVIVATQLQSGIETVYSSFEKAVLKTLTQLRATSMKPKDKNGTKKIVVKAIETTLALKNAIETGTVYCDRTWKWETRTFTGKSIEEMRAELND